MIYKQAVKAHSRAIKGWGYFPNLIEVTYFLSTEVIDYGKSL